jgi:putative oxidoreductase
MDGTRAGEPRLIFPGLAGFYNAVSDLWYPMLRITAGGFILAFHGYPKVMAGMGAVAGNMTRMGFQPPTLFAYITVFMETIGALCIVLGLGTRFFAAAMAIEFAIITVFVQFPRGWPNPEMYLIWGILLFAIALRGGGPYSVDRAIGKEL